MSLLRYISHADVIKDPDVPVPRWGLSPVGRRRVDVLARQPWLARVGRLLSSDETKAVETASILADRWDLEVEIRPATGETDRSATGYVSETRHAELAGRYFAHPTESADGWERAVDGQRRVVEALADVLAEPVAGPDEATGTPRPDVAVIGHGGVGTLLWSYLAGRAIDQADDQPHQGHYWTWDRSAGIVLHRWWPIDATDPPPPLADRSGPSGPIGSESPA